MSNVVQNVLRVSSNPLFFHARYIGILSRLLIKHALMSVDSADTHSDILLVKIFAEVGERRICDKTSIKAS